MLIANSAATSWKPDCAIGRQRKRALGGENAAERESHTLSGALRLAVKDKISRYNNCLVWRREWDSNPRYGFPYTRFPSERLQPLGHPSGHAKRAQYSGGPPHDNPTIAGAPALSHGTISTPHRCQNVHEATNEDVIGRGLLLWLLGIPLPIILLIWVFGGLHG